MIFCMIVAKTATKNLILLDINECEARPGLCKGGRCVNTRGSFKCECPPGLELTPDNQSCKDIDECKVTEG